MKLEPQKAKQMGAKSSRKGVPNRTTQEIREKIKDIIDDNIEKFQNDIDQLEPKERLKVLIDLSKFILPTLKAVDMQTENINDNFKPVIINFTNNTDTN